jgi:hypothetical protein
MYPRHSDDASQPSERRCSWLATLRLSLGWAVLLSGLTSCSLISLKTPEVPLSTRDLNARLLTRDQASQYMEATGRWGGNVAASEQDPVVFEHCLRWEIESVSASRRAALQLAPMMGLLDTWALAVQMQGFVSADGAGAALFGTHQAAVREMSDNFADGMQTVARRLMTPHDFSEYQRFVAAYVQEHPLRDLTFQRPSIVELWSHEKGGETKLIETLGTIPEALGDAEQRMQIYGDTVPRQALRASQLALRTSGYSKDEVQAALQRLDERLARMTAVAESAPELLQGAEDEVRQSVREVLNRLDATTSETAATLHTERAALFADLQSEREAVIAAVGVQRQALAEDAGRIMDRLVKESGAELRHLTMEVMLLMILFSVVLLGLPFAAGYLVGRAARRERLP